MTDTVLILDCGSTFLRSLSNELSDLDLTPVVVPSNYPLGKIRDISPSGIIINGSGSYVNAKGAEEVDTAIYDAGIPILGICYGHQRMAADLGGTVKRMPEHEWGCVQADLNSPQSVLFRDFTEEGAPVWMSHNCRVEDCPPGFEVTSWTDETEIASMEDTDRRLYGVQFHPEHRGADDSSQAGTAILWSFLQEVCGV